MSGLPSLQPLRFLYTAFDSLSIASTHTNTSCNHSMLLSPLNVCFFFGEYIHIDIFCMNLVDSTTMILTFFSFARNIEIQMNVYTVALCLRSIAARKKAKTKLKRTNHDKEDHQKRCEAKKSRTTTWNGRRIWGNTGLHSNNHKSFEDNFNGDSIHSICIPMPRDNWLFDMNIKPHSLLPIHLILPCVVSWFLFLLFLLFTSVSVLPLHRLIFSTHVYIMFTVYFARCYSFFDFGFTFFCIWFKHILFIWNPRAKRNTSKQVLDTCHCYRSVKAPWTEWMKNNSQNQILQNIRAHAHNRTNEW